MAATIKDIASRTGLGLATISKYLNGGNVKEANRNAIEQAIKELDFTVNTFARGLRTSKSKTIGVIIPELSNGFITSVITVLEDILRQHGYATIVCDSRTDESLQMQALEFLLGKQIDGLVIMPVGQNGAFLKPALERNIPVVLVDRKLENLQEPVSAVLVDNYRIARQSTEYLLERGHTEIGIIAGPDGIYTSEERLRGYCDALEAQGIPYREERVLHGGYTIEGGFQAMKDLLRQDGKLTAVFVTNYEMTVGSVLAINELGIAVPKQLSIIGFDNLELAKVVQPQLTIVEQPTEQIGQKTAALLLEQLENSEAVQTVLLEAKLRVGASVR